MEILVRFITCCGIYLRFYIAHSYWKEVKFWTFRDAKWKNYEKIGTFLLYSYFFLYSPLSHPFLTHCGRVIWTIFHNPFQPISIQDQWQLFFAKGRLHIFQTAQLLLWTTMSVRPYIRLQLAFWPIILRASFAQKFFWIKRLFLFLIHILPKMSVLHYVRLQLAFRPIIWKS